MLKFVFTSFVILFRCSKCSQSEQVEEEVRYDDDSQYDDINYDDDDVPVNDDDEDMN